MTVSAHARELGRAGDSLALGYMQGTPLINVLPCKQQLPAGKKKISTSRTSPGCASFLLAQNFCLVAELIKYHLGHNPMIPGKMIPWPEDSAVLLCGGCLIYFWFWTGPDRDMLGHNNVARCRLQIISGLFQLTLGGSMSGFCKETW